MAALEPGALVLAADTVVAAGRRILGKPADEAEAERFLRLLSGRRHRVTTALCLQGPDRIARRAVETRVRIKRLCETEIAAYLASGEWRGKAGGYAIQGIAGVFVPAIIGSYTNVVGLPLTETAALLRLPDGRSRAARLAGGRLEDLLIDPPPGGDPALPEALFCARIDRLAPGLGAAFARIGPEATAFLRDARGADRGRPADPADHQPSRARQGPAGDPARALQDAQPPS